jgi:hypothetical protein
VRGAELVRLDEKASVLIVAGLGLLTIIISEYFSISSLSSRFSTL